MDSTGEATVDDAVTWLRRRGRADDGGERVTQRTHTLQTAQQAEQPDDGTAMSVAGFLHAIGHVRHDLAPGYATRGIDDRPGTLGAP
jgi:predicted HD phosphohydrolase